MFDGGVRSWGGGKFEGSSREGSVTQATRACGFGGVGGWSDRHERSTQMMLYQAESPIREPGVGELGAAVGFEQHDSNCEELKVTRLDLVWQMCWIGITPHACRQGVSHFPKLAWSRGDSTGVK